MKKVFTIAALLLVVFSSGCTVPGLDIEIPGIPDIFGGGMNVQEQRHDIISIERLDAIPSATVRSGQSIRLRAVAKDLQKPEYSAIDKVEIGLYNTCGMFVVKGETCSQTPQPPNWNAENTDNSYSSCTVKMYPQSTTLVEWKLTAKDINVETPCKIGVMAKYYYRTHASASVTFVNKAEVERLVNEGKTFSETGTLVVGEGPVKPYIEVLNQPLIIDASTGVAENNRGGGIMSLWVENKGGGVMELAASKDGNVEFKECPATTPDVASARPSIMCLEITSSQTKGSKEMIVAADGEIQKCIQKHLETSTNSGKYSFSFISGKTPEYPCSITLDKTSDLKQETTYQIKATIGYFYKFTKELTLTVQPTLKL